MLRETVAFPTARFYPFGSWHNHGNVASLEIMSTGLTEHKSNREEMQTLSAVRQLKHWVKDKIQEHQPQSNLGKFGTIDMLTVYIETKE